jgi:hypothetical protein
MQLASSVWPTRLEEQEDTQSYKDVFPFRSQPKNICLYSKQVWVAWVVSWSFSVLGFSALIDSYLWMCVVL